MDLMASQLKFLLFILMYLLIKGSPASAAMPHNGLSLHPPAETELLSGLSTAEMLLKRGTLSPPAPVSPVKQSYIVHMEKPTATLTLTDITTRYTQLVQSATRQTSGRELDAGELADKVHYVYTNAMNGFAAHLTPDEVSHLSELPEVLAISPDQAYKTQTTYTSEFLGLGQPHGLWHESKFGDNVIVGLIDTGVWPESHSFNDVNLGPIPERWKGTCVDAGDDFNAATNCNKKLIGARFYAKGYQAALGPIDPTVESLSPRDTLGHGTHTASTSVGRSSAGATFYGLANGVARGMAPNARLAVYKSCWYWGCFKSDLLAAFDDAIADGVDVISVSISFIWALQYYYEPIAIGAYAAMKKGIFVAAAAGNNGPHQFSVANVAPWLTSVGAGTVGRAFMNNVKLGDGTVVEGMSLSGSDVRAGFLPLVYAGDAALANATAGDAAMCHQDALDPALVKGKMVLCDCTTYGNYGLLMQSYSVARAGAVGMIVANNANSTITQISPHEFVMPATFVDTPGGEAIKAYLQRSAAAAVPSSGGDSNPHPHPVAELVPETRLKAMPAPKVAAFSAQGPNPISLHIHKPDVIAPGVHILASWSDRISPSEFGFDSRRTKYNIISGTSMATPHVAGIAALLKSAHPTWSPSAIRSALMTTATTVDDTNQVMRDDSTNYTASPYAYGSGHVHPQRATDPGLIYDIAPDDYLQFLCAMPYNQSQKLIVTDDAAGCPATAMATTAKDPARPEDLNYPSFSAVFTKLDAAAAGGHGSWMTTYFTRTVTNVGPPNSTYRAVLEDMSATTAAVVTVTPDILVFPEHGSTQSFTLKVHVPVDPMPPVNSTSHSWGFMSWTDDTHVVRSPIGIVKLNFDPRDFNDFGGIV